MKNTIQKFLTAFFVLMSLITFAQVQDDVETGKDPIIIDLADEVEGYLEDGVEVKKLMKQIRQVELRQGDTYMYCDTAIIIDKEVTAYGNVILQQGDSVNVFADSLVYQGDSELADLFGNVVLQKEDQKLFTEVLRYDLSKKIATYDTGALLTNGGAQLRSKRGTYYVDNDLAYFSQEVVVVDTSFTLQADTLEFDTKLEIATFLGPTLIRQDSSQIYCEAGFYDIANKQAEFRQNAQYQKGDQIATGDFINYDGISEEVQLRGDAQFVEGDKIATADIITYDQKREITFLDGNAVYRDSTQFIEGPQIEYNSKSELFNTFGRSTIVDDNQILTADTVDYDSNTEFGYAFGNVVWEDTVENTVMYMERADYNKTTDYLMASGGRPMLVSASDGDTLRIAADTLKSFKLNPEDSVQNFVGYPDVRIFKSDLQGLADSIYFDGQDSIFYLVGNPILWSDSSQFFADSIRIYLVNDEIDKILFIENGLVVNTSDTYFFNQVQGRTMTAFFEEGELDRMMVNGNAISIYYALDEEEAYIGVNKSISSKMMLYFVEGDIKKIHYLKDPKSEVFPMRKADHKGLQLANFKWDWDKRPKSVEELRTPRVVSVLSSNGTADSSDQSMIRDTLVVIEKDGVLKKEKDKNIPVSGKDKVKNKIKAKLPVDPKGKLEEKKIIKLESGNGKEN